VAGDELAGVIDANIDRADIILLLMSPDFIASDSKTLLRWRSGRNVRAA
jgi:hypothetical protein